MGRCDVLDAADSLPRHHHLFNNASASKRKICCVPLHAVDSQSRHRPAPASVEKPACSTKEVESYSATPYTIESRCPFLAAGKPKAGNRTLDRLTTPEGVMRSRQKDVLEDSIVHRRRRGLLAIGCRTPVGCTHAAAPATLADVRILASFPGVNVHFRCCLCEGRHNWVAPCVDDFCKIK